MILSIIIITVVITTVVATEDGVRGAAQGIPFAFDAAVRDDTKLLFRLVIFDIV